MKTLRLAFSRIITYFLENKIIFVLYFIGTVACIFMMIFYYGNTLTYKTRNVPRDDIDFRIFKLSLSSPTEITPQTIEKLKEFEQEYDIQDIELTAIVDADGKNINFKSNEEASAYNTYYNSEYKYSSDVEIDVGYELQSKDFIVVRTFLNNNNDNVASSIDDRTNLKASIFTDEELSKNVAAAPNGEAEDIRVGDKTLKVVKNQSENDYFIPIDAYFESGIKTWTITIWVKERFSENMMYRYVDFLRNTFNIKYDPDVDCEGVYDFIRFPQFAYSYESGFNLGQFYSISYIFILSVISFMFLLKYLMDSCRRENSILMMVGAKKKRIVLLNLIENIILTFISSAVAVVLHIVLYDSLVTKINLYKNITYSAQDYLIIVLLAIGLSLIVQIPFIFTYWFKNIRNIKEG